MSSQKNYVLIFLCILLCACGAKQYTKKNIPKTDTSTINTTNYNNLKFSVNELLLSENDNVLAMNIDKKLARHTPAELKMINSLIDSLYRSGNVPKDIAQMQMDEFTDFIDVKVDVNVDFIVNTFGAASTVKYNRIYYLSEISRQKIVNYPNYQGKDITLVWGYSARFLFITNQTKIAVESKGLPFLAAKTEIERSGTTIYYKPVGIKSFPAIRGILSNESSNFDVKYYGKFEIFKDKLKNDTITPFKDKFEFVALKAWVGNKSTSPVYLNYESPVNP